MPARAPCTRWASGSVGSGKSSILAACLGEMEKLSGQINVFGTTAYAPQLAWIQNATLRDNILFGRRHDAAFYSQVLTGDTADGYPGCKGIGPVAASKALADCKTEEDMWLAVQRAYLKAGHPVDFAVQMARCARILRPGEYDHNRRMPRLWTPPSYGA